MENLKLNKQQWSPEETSYLVTTSYSATIAARDGNRWL
ncbi:hypothetical protein KUCAC02_000740 [Chaenocephalus aceratus]|uniref:Uncharacterized protein n=1 Tax=Chaenocephalus aceratus TaxID=36190 RepID=A0ACB9W6F7_CHAAC|nr:hypothetical protein KUCAC02_000740 [Chaenocephalus aceratus]